MRGIRIQRCVEFSASHQLTRFPDGHKCARLHGHNYTVEVAVWAPRPEPIGVIIDFAALDEVVRRWDHTNLNDDPELEDNPTSELLALVLYRRLAERLPKGAIIERVRVSETSRSWAEVTS